MLKRIYIDNFRCLVDFELSVDQMNLFLGPNSSGKSTVFDALRKIQAFVIGDDKVNVLFEPDDLTRWQNSPIQRFELEICGNGGIYNYELAIEHDRLGSERGANVGVRVASERLLFDQKPLLDFKGGEGKLYLDNQKESVTILGGFAHSAVDFFSSEDGSNSEANAALTWFRERMKRFIIVKVIPPFMARESSRPEAQLSAKMENFVSWYRYIYQKGAGELNSVFEQIFEGFSGFKLAKAGEQHRVLNLSFSNGHNGHNEHQPIEYRFYEMSDGDRALIALYTLIHHARFNDYTLCIDEPESFMPLAEIQPWLMELHDFCGDGDLQALLISHHPEFINLLAFFAGYWFDRDDNKTPVRVKQLTDDNTGGFPVSELVARGWIHG